MVQWQSTVARTGMICLAFGALAGTEDAVVAYKKASSLAPQAFEPHQALGALFWRNRLFADAVREYEHAMHLGDSSYATRITLCQSYDRLGRYRPAIACYEQVLASSPND